MLHCNDQINKLQPCLESFYWSKSISLDNILTSNSTCICSMHTIVRINRLNLCLTQKYLKLCFVSSSLLADGWREASWTSCGYHLVVVHRRLHYPCLHQAHRMRLGEEWCKESLPLPPRILYCAHACVSMGSKFGENAIGNLSSRLDRWWSHRTSIHAFMFE